MRISDWSSDVCSSDLTGVGGGVLRDVLVREIPVVLRAGLYAVPALVGATIVVIASENGSKDLAFTILGAAVCFAIRLAGMYFDINMPRPRSHPRGSRSEEHTSALQSLMRISYAVF